MLEKGAVMSYCNCYQVVGFRQGVSDIRDEVLEFVEEPSLDEFSDVMYGFGRLIAGFFGKKYFRMPFDSLHVAKIDARMSEYGCIRSRRRLVLVDETSDARRCPSWND